MKAAWTVISACALALASSVALVKRDYERWIPVVKASGFVADEQ